MTEHRHVSEKLPWLVAGSLPPDEAETVRRHVDGCAECRAELARAAFAARLFAAEHPTGAELVDAAWDRLDDERVSEIESHVADCADCAEALALARASRVAQAAQPAQAPAVSRWPLAWAASTLILAAAVVWLLVQQAETRPRPVEVPVEVPAEVLAGVPVIELLPETVLRGDPPPTAAEVGRGASPAIVLLLALERPTEHPVYSARLVDETGNVLFDAPSAAPDATGALSLIVPTDLLPDGRAAVEVRSEEGRLVARYPLSVLPRPSQPSTTNGAQ